MSKRYHLAIVLDKDKNWVETFGSMDRRDVAVEMQDWRDTASRIKAKIYIHSTTFDHIPTQKEVKDFVKMRKEG